MFHIKTFSVSILLANIETFHEFRSTPLELAIPATKNDDIENKALAATEEPFNASRLHPHLQMTGHYRTHAPRIDSSPKFQKSLKHKITE